MLTLHGQPHPDASFCDGLTRRNFLRIGSLGLAGGLGGFSLPQLLKAESDAGIRQSNKSIVMIYLVGGPPHQDLVDLKPDAPKEVAGPWRPIATNVPGFEICEALPRRVRESDGLAMSDSGGNPDGGELLSWSR